MTIPAFTSPVQVGSDTTWSSINGAGGFVHAIKTDGTLWAMGYNNNGELGDLTVIQRSSPTQIPGTTWNSVEGLNSWVVATKTDGTMWNWGQDHRLGVNAQIARSSPTQIPGTDWNGVVGGAQFITYAIKQA